MLSYSGFLASSSTKRVCRNVRGSRTRSMLQAHIQVTEPSRSRLCANTWTKRSGDQVPQVAVVIENGAAGIDKAADDWNRRWGHNDIEQQKRHSQNARFFLSLAFILIDVRTSGVVAPFVLTSALVPTSARIRQPRCSYRAVPPPALSASK